MTAVVHLVRHANGTAPFEAFLDSYSNHEAGHEHELDFELENEDQHKRAFTMMRP